MLTASVVESIKEVGRGAWTTLTEAAEASVFYGWDFLLSVEEQPLTSPSKAFYVLLRDGRELVAAVPMYLLQTRDPFAADSTEGPVRGLFSHVWHCYDTTLISGIPHRRDLIGHLWGAIEHLAEELSADVWGLVNVAADSALANGLTEIGLLPDATAARYRLPTAGGARGLDEHLAGIGRSSRRTLRQYARRAARAGAVVSWHEGRVGLDQQVLDLCLATADKHAAGYYPPAELAALVERLGPACRILRVELDGVLLAASLCLYDRTRMHTWAGGCRYPEDLNWSPQYVLFAAELQAAFTSGRPMLECGRRNDEFKRRYGLRAYPLCRAVRRPGSGR